MDELTKLPRDWWPILQQELRVESPPYQGLAWHGGRAAPELLCQKPAADCADFKK